MKTDEMVRQAKSVVTTITELAARLTAVQSDFKTANDALDDACAKLAATLRIPLGECPLEDIVEAVTQSEARRRKLEAGLSHVLQTLSEPRFVEVSVTEARIELEKLLP